MGLSPTHFRNLDEREIFSQMVCAEKEQRSFDLPSVGVLLPRLATELVEIIESAPVGQNVDFYVRVMLGADWKRRASEALIDLGHTIASCDDHGPIAHLQEKAIALADSLSSAGADTTSFRNVRVVAEQVVKNIEDAIKLQMGGAVVGIDTGLPTLNSLLGGGWRKGRVASISARSGRGKTTMALCMTRAAVLAGKKVVFCSIESSGEELLERIIANDAAINSTRLMNGILHEGEDDRLMFSISRLAQTNLHFDDTFGGDIDVFESTVRRLHRQGLCDLVVLDYVQQCFDASLSRFGKPQMLAQVTGRIKRLAMALNVPIVELSQLNRTVDKSTEFPTAADISDTSSIEKDSDHVFILHWVSDHGDETPVLRVIKNRIGPCGTDITLDADLGLARFTERGRYL